MKIGRVIATLVLIIAVFQSPWWMTILLAGAASVVFRSYYEFVVIGIMLDSLYNTAIPEYYGFQYVATLISIVILAITTFIRARVRFFEVERD